LRFDYLSAVMALVVTGVGSLIHLYSIGYMKQDPDNPRYFSYLNLFMSAMLILILADNLLVMFIGWEGVGLASYLLIGFWFKDTEKAKAGMKAFIVNRIGDLGFLLGIFVIFWSLLSQLPAGTALSSFSFAELQHYIQYLQQAEIFGFSAIEVAGFCLLLGAIGKSAQIPLHVWLPDAMAGPTPVSALIHAATMVTAGVYMIARMNFLYTLAPIASTTIAIIGAVTALVAASIALFQNDIKKVLAYSTVSQLGFMFMAVGVGAYTAGIFHLMTHAFFKGLLFLGAGSVIVAMHHQQDIRRMGGLFRHIKITSITFLIASLAIIGFPGFSGFFSKDEILWKTIAYHHPIIWLMGMIAAILTAFYMTRLFCLVFLGSPRTTHSTDDAHDAHTPRENPPIMTIPLILLAIFSAIGGFIGIPHVITHKSPPIESWLAPIFVKQSSVTAYIPIFSEWTVMILALCGMLLGVAIAFTLYLGKNNAENSIACERAYQQPNVGGFLGFLYRLVYHKYYIDEIYQAIIVRPIHLISRDGLWPFDQIVIDGIVNLSAKIAQLCGRILSWFQTGNVKLYLYAMAIGLISMLLWLMLNPPG
jgi:NADH-quinone oxidoreductase subunit L